MRKCRRGTIASIRRRMKWSSYRKEANMLVDAVLAAKPGADEEFKAVTINLDRDDNNMKYNTEGRNAVT